MNKNIIIGIVVACIVLVGGILVSKKTNTQKQESTIETTEKETPEKETNKEKTNVLSYSGAVIDEDKCGKDAFYVKEKSVDFVKNYCKFLRDNGWKLVHQDYPDCEDIKSFGGGYNYEKGAEKMSISVIKYGEDATCFWVYPK